MLKAFLCIAAFALVLSAFLVRQQQGVCLYAVGMVNDTITVWSAPPPCTAPLQADIHISKAHTMCPDWVVYTDPSHRLPVIDTIVKGCRLVHRADH